MDKGQLGVIILARTLASEAKVPRETAWNEPSPQLPEALFKGQVPFWGDWGVVKPISNEFSL